MGASIVISTHNDEGNIFNVVASCCRNCSDCEIIVVDSGSNDNTQSELEILSRHHTFTRLYLPVDSGKNRARVCGAEYASNEVLLFIDAKMPRLQKNDFAKLLQPILTEKVDMVFGYPPEFITDYHTDPYSDFAINFVAKKDDVEPLFRDLNETLFGGDFLLLLYYQSLGKRVKSVAIDSFKRPEPVNRKFGLNDEQPNLKSEIASNILNNINLITKRLLNKISNSQEYSDFSISSVQNELNMKMLQHNS
jgi:glycosyltransferase involved in cell wall biosynthesis